MANVKLITKVLLRSRSLQFTRDYFGGSSGSGLRTYDWGGTPVHYRAGTSDAALIYNILLKRGRKGEYSLPSNVRLDDVRVVLDIGANIGVAALYFARAFPHAVVHAFEPEPGNCAVLQANAQSIARIRPHAFALGAQDGEITLFDSDDKTNFGGYSTHGMGVDPTRSKTVPVRHAAGALSQLGIGRVDIIKIDTEGSEWEILTAMGRATLKDVRVILGELHGRRDFALLDFLQPDFHIGAKKQLKNRLFNFVAINRQIA
jgi:FkbM family methyltransferase